MHFQRWGRSCFYGDYHFDNIFKELGACHLNSHIQIFARWLSSFMGGCKGQQFRSTSIPCSLQVGLWPYTSICSSFHPPSEQLLKSRTIIGENNRLFQKSILKNMHKHSFSNILSKLSFDYHHAQLGSCVSLGLGAQFFACLVIPSFRMTFDIFSLTLHARLSLHHPIACGFPRCICDQTINPTWIHLFCCVHGGKCIITCDVVQDPFTSIVKDAKFHVLCEQTHFLSMPSLQTS